MKNPNDKIVRVLSTGTIISSALFSRLPATKQTEILAVAQAAKKPFVFVDSFSALSNTRKLAERLLAGETVTMELEFNNITLSDDERKGLELVRPLLERLNAMKPAGYEWLPQEQIDAAAKSEFYELNTYRSEVYDKGGNNSLEKRQCERIWKLVAPWYMGGDKPKSFTLRIHYSNRTVTFNDDQSIKIGCQTISRAGAEAVAKRFGFTAPEPK